MYVGMSVTKHLFYLLVSIRYFGLLYVYFLTFALLGGLLRTPLRFFQIVKKRRRAAPQFVFFF